MFSHLGCTLGLVRDLRGLSQAGLAKHAGIGKSQLSKYENGKELPKLDSLAKVLRVLEINPAHFFATMHLVQSGLPMSSPGNELRAIPLLEPGQSILHPSTDHAFHQAFTALLTLYRQILVNVLVPHAGDFCHDGVDGALR